MAVILVYFNPTQSIRIIQNIMTVKFWLEKANIPIFIGEIAFEDTPFLFAPTPNVCQFRSSSFMFYKENLISLTEKIIPPSYTKLCLLDADILFMEPSWYDTISTTLDSYTACQPFKTAHLLNIDYTITTSYKSILSAPPGQKSIGLLHPGYSWAVTRVWYQTCNPSDLTVVGGGDRILYSYITNPPMDPAKNALENLYSFLIPSIHSSPPILYTSCPLTVIHLNHGITENRQYGSRTQNILNLLKSINSEFTLLDVIERRGDGVLEWRPEYRPLLNTFFYEYFTNRLDDSPASGIISGRSDKFFPINYISPSATTPLDMAVILVYFNPVNYCRSVQNLLMTKHWLDKASIPLFIGELQFNDHPFLFPVAENICQVHSASVMFYKENLIRYVEQRLPSHFTKICMMDADIFYNAPDWYSTISRTLDTCTVIQPYKTANWLAIDFTVTKQSSSNVIDVSSGHPGFVWAFQRDWFRTFQLEDRSAIVTSGDTILADLLNNRSIKNPFLNHLFGSTPHPRAGMILGSCDISIYHLNHGSLIHRHYNDLVNIWRRTFERMRIRSIDEIYDRRSDGILEWKPTLRTELNKIMINYFKSRQEDAGF